MNTKRVHMRKLYQREPIRVNITLSISIQ
ncbi:hypothetical protein Patl1_32520 [Pistacia atlantica]|uniref:Uncharacterized protein n=1 Tax=Pistacia atlantica TaxID=434234 RepID=A0ACC1ANS8_9ROSI|nr:hypothetical protein Patl1_32520 [Pistacia atlantica]